METKITVTHQQIKDSIKDIVVSTTEEFGQIVTDMNVTMKNGFVLHKGVASDSDSYNKEADKAYCLKCIKNEIRLILEYTLYDRVNNEKNIHEKFKPFQKVLVKVTNDDDDNHVWIAAMYSHYNESKGRHYFSNMQWTDDDSGIIPFEGNEDKLGQIVE